MSTVSITQDNLLRAVRTFCLSFLPDGVEVVRGQQNRVPPPASSNYVVMTPLFLSRLSTNEDNYVRFADPGDGTRNAKSHIDATFQLDVHGPDALNNCTIIQTLFRDPAGCESFAAWGFEMQPLYTSDPKQVPFINGEDQYEDRWTIDLHVQFNPVIETPQQFAKTLGPIGLIPVETTYPADGEG